MERNVEFKPRVPDFPSLRNRVESICEVEPEVIIQEDTFFNVPKGRLKLRCSDRKAELIYYERENSVGPGESRYLRSSSSNPDSLLDLLSAALGIRGVVRKKRTLFRKGQIRIHLDQVEDLGEFLEIEVVLKSEQTLSQGKEIALKIMERLDLEPEHLTSDAYIDLLERRTK